MRRSVTVLLLVLLLAPGATAQSAAPPVEVLQDGTGDLEAEAEGQKAPFDADAYTDMDLTGLTVEERREAFVFTVAVADIKEPQEENGEGGLISVRFRHNDREFDLQIDQNSIVGSFTDAYLLARPVGTEEWSWVWYDPEAVSVDRAGDAFVIAVPREQLADEVGAPPFVGRSLQGFWAESRTLFSGASFFNLNGQGGLVRSPLYIRDRMPDDGMGTVDVEVRLGLAQVGHLVLHSDDPRRASNGEASTFVFEAYAHNTGGDDDLAVLAAKDVPSGWSVVFPHPVIALEAGQTATFPVVVSTPFAHQHGSAKTFVVEATSESAPTAVGRVELGLTYLATPQPAGHHDTLYFHSLSGEGFTGTPADEVLGWDRAFMNAAETFDGDEAIPVSGSNGLYVDDTVYTVYGWQVPLDPGLRMGLDFDLEGQAELTVPIKATLAELQATLTAELVLVQGGWWFDEDNPRLATFKAEPVDLLPGDEKTYTLTSPIDPAADLVPYERGQSLVLGIRLTSSRPPTFLADEAPVLLPGGSLRLPLFEYHDPVDEVFQADGDGPRLAAVGAAERLANPGDTVRFPVDLSNPGPESRFGLSVVGLHAEHVRLPGGGSVTVPRDGTARIDVEVDVPETMADGERIDIVLQADAEDQLPALVRLVVEADTEKEHEGDAPAPAADGGKESPGAASILLLGAVLALAGRRRMPGRQG